MQDKPIDLKSIGLLFGFLASILTIHLALDRTDSWLVPIYGVAFAFYIISYRKIKFEFKYLLILAVAIRLFLFLDLPNLSDDYFRFLWDGQIWSNGINPYGYTPASIIDQLPLEFNALFQNLNSKEYHSTYPPISQFIFAIPSRFGIVDIFWSVNVIRAVLLLFDLGVIFLLYKLTADNSKVMLYALNPLVILELVGNLHFEGTIIFFVVLAIVLFQQNRQVKGAMSLAFAIMTKLTPLMFLPILIKKTGVKKSFMLYASIGSVMLLLLIPFLGKELFGLSEGLDLFFRKFEFNASVFFLVRMVGFWLKGYDVILDAGPWLTVIAFSLIMIYALAIVKNDTPWAEAFVVILFIQLMFATTVHPWYTIPLIAFGILSGFNFPVLWSALVFLTYLGYNSSGYNHPMFWIFIEYLILIPYALYELLILSSKRRHA